MFKIDGKNAFVCDEAEFSGVKKIADKVCLDVERVTGKKPVLAAGDTGAYACLQWGVLRYWKIQRPYEESFDDLPTVFLLIGIL